MLDALGYVLPYFVEYRYLAIFLALTSAGFGVPVPEELTIVLSGYLAAIGMLHPGLTLLVCYFGVLAGDLVTYFLGRLGGSRFLDSRYARWIISEKKLEQVQYYYRGYGPYYLLGARQLPGLRFPSFFMAGMVRMRFWKFLVYDALAALVSMPVAFGVAYYFGPQFGDAIQVILKIRNLSLVVGLVIIGLTGLLLFLYWYMHYRSRQSNESTDSGRK